jgi:glutamyl/glutaminyl-tRNA synthetase
MTDMPEDFLLSMDHDKLDLIASMAVERVEFSYELKDSLSYIYNTPILEDEIKMKNVEEFIKVMNVFAADDFMSNFDEDDWTPKNIRYELEHISGNMSIGVGKIMPMLRVAICGGASGPQLPDVMYVIGSKETKARIEALLNKIKELA